VIILNIEKHEQKPTTGRKFYILSRECQQDLDVIMELYARREPIDPNKSISLEEYNAIMEEPKVA
jgi:hypothetical protein